MELLDGIKMAVGLLVYIANSAIIFVVVTNPLTRTIIISIYLFIIFLFGGTLSYIIVLANSITFIFLRRRHDRKMMQRVEQKLDEYSSRKRWNKKIT